MKRHLSSNMLNPYPTVLIGAPVRNRGWILPLYLRHILELDYPKDRISLRWILNDSFDNSKEILEDFRRKYFTLYKSIMVSEYDFNFPNDMGEKGNGRHSNGIDRSIYTAPALSICRNLLLDTAQATQQQFVFFIDTDILVKPDVLNNLLDTDKDVVAALVKNDNIWAHNFFHKNKSWARDYFPSSLFEVDVTGAVMLVSSNIINNRNIRYFPTPTGEDEGFCINVRKYKIPLWVLNDLQTHVMTEKDREELGL